VLILLLLLLSAKKMPTGFWRNIENRKKFFLDFAAERGFDPMKVENWDNISHADMKIRKVFLNLPPFVNYHRFTLDFPRVELGCWLSSEDFAVHCRRHSLICLLSITCHQKGDTHMK